MKKIIISVSVFSALLVLTSCTNTIKNDAKSDSFASTQNTTSISEVNSSSTQSDAESINATPTQPAIVELMQSWEKIVTAANNNDCDTFKTMLTNDIETTDTTCSDVNSVFKSEIPNVRWDLTEFNSGGNEAKTYVDFGDGGIGLLTIFTKKSDGEWKATKKFWYEKATEEATTSESEQ